MNRHFFTVLSVAALLSAALPVSAREIHVTGHVRDEKKKEPLPAVTIYNADTDRLVGTTNEDGYYELTIDDDATLVFSILGSEDKTVPVNGRQAIEVTLDPSSVVLGEIVVQAKGKPQLSVDPTDITVEGNYLHIKTHLKVPSKLFGASDRMIVQPTIANVTKGIVTPLRPLVFDGKRYAITQERMHDWNRNNDPLTPFVTIAGSRETLGNVLTINDSLYVDNPEQDFRCDLYSIMEDYNRIYYSDTVTIARGTVNPLRFLAYDLKGKMVDEEEFFPTPEMQLRDSRGDVNLTFQLGKSNLDMNLGKNSSEVSRLIAMLKNIENDPGTALKSFTIFGTASPEGNPARNEQLARDRVASAMQMIIGALPESLRRNADISSSGSVATWEQVAELMSADGLDEQARELKETLDHAGHDARRREALVRKLPFYRSIIETTYLPRLRRVEYELVTSKYRYLTDEEIADIYETDPNSMSRYEFHRLYTLAPDTTMKRQIMEYALKVHPNFMVAATDLAYLDIEKKEPKSETLQRFINGKIKTPAATRLNHAIALMNDRSFMRADSLAQTLPDMPPYSKAKTYARATSGHYEEVIQEVSADSPFNEVLLLLAIKANDKAWQKAQKLGDSAREEYIKAVAANRVNQYMAAITHLEHAIALDPSLRQLAEIDGDVLDLLEPEE